MHLPIHATWDGAALDAGERADVRIARAGNDWEIEVDAPFHGDPAPALVAGSCPELWSYEAVECFLVGEQDDRYLEVELGPHGHYLLLELRGPRNIVRQGMSAPYESAIDRERGRWRGRIVLAGGLVPAPIARVNAFALHGCADRRRYLCFAPLPGARPDFHQPRRFPPFIAPTGAAAGARAAVD